MLTSLPRVFVSWMDSLRIKRLVVLLWGFSCHTTMGRILVTQVKKKVWGKIRFLFSPNKVFDQWLLESLIFLSVLLCSNADGSAYILPGYTLSLSGVQESCNDVDFCFVLFFLGGGGRTISLLASLFVERIHVSTTVLALTVFRSSGSNCNNNLPEYGNRWKSKTFQEFQI